MTDIPSGWNRVTLNDLGNWVTGATPQSKDPLNFGDEVEFVTPSDIGYGGRLGVVERRISELGASRVRKLKAPSVNLVCIGTIGKVALANREVTTNQQINSLEPNESVVLPNFAMWLLASPKIQEALWQASSSTTVAILNKGNLCKIETSIPPLPEQHKIVEILEDHLSRLDAALADVKQAKEKAAQFRRSLLQAAFSGNLGSYKYRVDVALPDGWNMRKLSDVADWTSGGTPSSKDASLYGGDIPWVVIGDLTESRVYNTEKTITQKGLESSSAKILPKGTVMLAMYGASIGRTGIMDRDMATNQAIACGVPKMDQVDVKFLLYFLQSQKQEFVFAGKGGAQPNIGQGIVKNWEIPLPDLSEQRKIIGALEAELSRFEASVALIDSIEKQAVGYRRSLLHAAFTGKLTKEVVSV